MKRLRTNKLKSNLSFLTWLVGASAKQLLSGGFQPPSIESLNDETRQRVNYYFKLNSSFTVQAGCTIKDIPYFRKTGYNFDFHRLMAPFPKLNFHHLWGDIKHVPEVPTFVRSRPISDDNQNSALLPLNTRRLFETYPDPYTFEEKTPTIVWRGAVYKKHREDLLAAGAALPFCDFGATNKENPKLAQWVRPWMTPLQQMRCKFIFVIEGNDIASNIQWAMASNSVCMMRRPRFESWFAEGLLKAGFHYIEVADDFSDLREKFDYYLDNTAETLRMISNANAYVRQFRDLSQQYGLGQAVIQKYASLSGQA